MPTWRAVSYSIVDPIGGNTVLAFELSYGLERRKDLCAVSVARVLGI